MMALGRQSWQWRAETITRRRRVPRRRAGFSLVELLVVVAIVALLVSLLLPSLSAAREAGLSAVCSSNLRQLQLANETYTHDFGGRYAPGASDFVANLSRWHGSRSHVSEAFVGSGGSLSAYIDSAGGASGVRACPSFAGVLDRLEMSGAGFERGNGGYGYNNAYVGVDRPLAMNGQGRGVASDRRGAPSDRFCVPSRVLSFADGAFAFGGVAGVVEYSFVEPRFWPENRAFRADPSVHFRHGGGGVGASNSGSRLLSANVAWLDGHVSGERMSASHSSGLYHHDPGSLGVGWFGEHDDNELFGERELRLN